MLQELLAVYRDELIERCTIKATLRAAPSDTREAARPNGIPPILDQLIDMLRMERLAATPRTFLTFGRPGASKARQSGSDVAASQYGRDLLQNGFPVEEVAYGFGDLCQSVTDLAVEHDETIQACEFRILNFCLDQAIADALTGYCARPPIPPSADPAVRDLHVWFGSFVHELRNHLHTATIALAASKISNTLSPGATATVDRSMNRMRNLVRCSLADSRAMADQPVRRQVIALADFIEDIKLSASLEAHARNCVLVVEAVDPSIDILVDADLLFSALNNLLQNAFKFTCRDTQVTLKAYATGDRVLIQVADSCGGLPAGGGEEMFRPFTQVGRDRSGVGLGLSICRRSVEANGGIVGVRNVPGKGCIFTIDLPRQATVKQPVASLAG
jgi:signal transduction histidine kinase